MSSNDRALWLAPSREEIPGVPEPYDFRHSLRKFMRLWYQAWFLHTLYQIDHGKTLGLEQLHDNGEWLERAVWMMQFSSGKAIFPVSCMNTLARITVMKSLGTNDYRRLVHYAYRLVGRRVTVLFDHSGQTMTADVELGLDVLEIGMDKSISVDNAYAPSAPLYQDEASAQTEITVTPFLECIPVADYRVGDIPTLGFPMGIQNVMSDQVVMGLHPPSICHLCDKIRIRLPNSEALTDEDKIQVALLHVRRSMQSVE